MTLVGGMGFGGDLDPFGGIDRRKPGVAVDVGVDLGDHTFWDGGLAIIDEALQKDKLKGDIDALFPLLRKTDTTTQMAQLLNIVARGKTMGKPGYDMLKAFAERLNQQPHVATRPPGLADRPVVGRLIRHGLGRTRGATIKKQR